MKGDVKTLKTIVAVGLFTLAGLLPGPIQDCRAQILVGGAASQTAAPLASVPATGTFFSATLNLPPWPTDWLPQLPVYAYDASNNIFIVDDRGWDYSASGNAMFSAAGQSGGMGAMEMSGPPPPPTGGGSGSTNSGGGISMPMVKYTTNDLWLEIAVTLKGMPSNLVIHTPWYVTNGVYNILTTTNLAPPIVWQWFTNTAPGQTNIPLTNTTDPQRFFALGLTNSSAGTDFWFAYLDNFGPANLSLYISSQETALGTVIMPGLSLTNSFSLAPGTATNINLTNAAAILNWDVIATNGIHIVSSAPVSAYGLSYALGASDAFAAYPTPMLGTNYLLLARPSDVHAPWSSQFAIVGTASNTTVKILPSATADLATNTGSNTLTITLQPGSTYEIYSSYYTDDVTGTIITSDHPIAVFAGANTAHVPDGGTGAANPLVQEQLPVASWGRQALALSFGRRYGDSFRVLAANDSTSVSTNGVFATNLDAGNFLTPSWKGRWSS